MREMPLMKRCSPRRGKNPRRDETDSRSFRAFTAGEQKDGWQPVEIRSADGTKLRGTYIENSRSSDRTVILLHGLYQNRSMCIPYVDMYRDMGYNVLLIDQRKCHGKAAAAIPPGVFVKRTILTPGQSGWRGKDGGVKIGMHGISLGAAMALIYSGTERGKNISFYVADSAYGGMMELGKDKISAYTGDPRFCGGWISWSLFPKRPVAEERKDTVRHRSAGGGQTYDSACPFSPRRRGTLIPPKTAEELLQASGSSKKELLFLTARHTMEMAVNGDAYRKAVAYFLKVFLKTCDTIKDREVLN